MAYVITGDRPVAREGARIAAKQLEQAAADLNGARRDQNPLAIHQARRRLKKVRALLRLIDFDPASVRGTLKRLRRIKRNLAAVSDAHAVLSTFDRLKSEHQAELPGESFATIRRQLAHRLRRTQQRTRAMGVLDDALRTLKAERGDVGHWRCESEEFEAVARGVRRTYKRARKAFATAKATPRVASFHRWRRRVKDHWLQLRLLSLRGGDQLRGQRQLAERLDGVLGRLHDYALLQRAIRVEPLDSRHHTAVLLRILRRCEHAARQKALALGRELFSPETRRFARQVRGMWVTTTSVPRADVVGTWQTVA